MLLQAEPQSVSVSHSLPAPEHHMPAADASATDGGVVEGHDNATPEDEWLAPLPVRQEQERAAKVIAAPLPLFLACVEGHADVVQVLLDAGVNPNTLVEHPVHGCPVTPLWAAAEAGRAKVVSVLVERGAAVSTCRPTDNASPLWIAVANKHPRTVAQLIILGSNVNAATANDGLSPLHVAVAHADVDMVQLLARHGGDLSQHTTVDYGAVTPQGLASVSRNPALMQALRRCDTQSDNILCVHHSN